MAPEKATITPEGGEEIKVCFNPTQYSLDHSNRIAEINVPAKNGPPIDQFVHGNSRTLSLDLLFDTYEQRVDVRKAYTDKIYKLLEIPSGKKEPPICTFTWKDVILTCVLERVSGRFTMFLEDGTPVRATLSVSFREHKPASDVAGSTAAKAADSTKTYIVKLGDTLSGIAAAMYGGATQWRLIAIANGIANPLRLTPGQALVIPPKP